MKIHFIRFEFRRKNFLPVELRIEIEPSELPQANIKPYSYGAQATVFTKITKEKRIYSNSLKKI